MAMGDADGEVTISAQEVEAWLDEGAEFLDEGFDTLLGLVTSLNERTKVILQELKILESFRTVFIALNVFIVPVVIAFMLRYGMKESFIRDKLGFQAGFQSLVMLLMILSSSVGLPFYIIALWDSYRIIENINEEPENGSLANESQNPSLMLDDSLLTPLTSAIERMQRLNEFERWFDLQRMGRTENDASEQGTLPGMDDSSEMEMESAVTGSAYSAEPGPRLDGGGEKSKATEFPILYEFQVLMAEPSPDLAVRLEAANREESKETIQNEVVLVQDERHPTKPQDGPPSAAVNATVFVSS